jgi:outer membrane protein TolC
MKMTGITPLFALAALCSVLLGGSAITAAADPPAATRQTPAEETKRLLAERFKAAADVFRIQEERMEVGAVTFDSLFAAAKDLLVADREQNPTAQGRLDAATRHATLMRGFEQDAVRRFDAGRIPQYDVEQARYWRLVAEIALRRLQLGSSTKKQASDQKLQDLITARLDCVKKMEQITRERIDSGKATFDELRPVEEMMLATALEHSATVQGRTDAANRYVTFMRDDEKRMLARLEAGLVPKLDAEKASYRRMHAEIQLLRLQRENAAAKPASDQDLRDLLLARFDSATKVLKGAEERYAGGLRTIEDLLQDAQALRDAELEQSTTPEARLTAMTNHLTFLRRFEQDVNAGVNAGAKPTVDAAKARCWRLTAELDLLRLRTAAPKKK